MSQNIDSIGMLALEPHFQAVSPHFNVSGLMCFSPCGHTDGASLADLCLSGDLISHSMDRGACRLGFSCKLL